MSSRSTFGVQISSFLPRILQTYLLAHSNAVKHSQQNEKANINEVDAAIAGPSSFGDASASIANNTNPSHPLPNITISSLSDGIVTPHLQADGIFSNGMHEFSFSVEGALVFIDMSGFTALSERLSLQGMLGVEALSSHLNSFFGPIVQLLQSYGGDIIKFAGDAIIVLFTDQAGLHCSSPLED